MAEVRVTALPAATSLENTDVLHGVQSSDGRDRQFSLLNLKGYMSDGLVTSVFGRDGAVVATEGDYNLDLLGDVDLSTAPTNGQGLVFNGSVWIAADVAGGTVTEVTGTAPIQVVTGTTTPVISVTAATTTDPGVMTAADKSKLDSVATGAQVNVPADLTYTTAADTGTVNCSSGTDATIPAATTSLAGLMTATDKTKLDGIPAGGGSQGTVTNVTGTAPVVITGTSTTTPNVTVSAATTSAAGVMSAADKTKLDGIATGATANTGTVTSVAGTAPIVITGTATTTPTVTVSTGTEAARGVLELATAAETTTGTDATRAVHPAGLKVELDKKLNLTGGAMTGGVTQTIRTITAGAFDLSTGNLWDCGGIAVPNPTNAVAGMTGVIILLGAPTGWGGNFAFPGGAPPNITTVPAAIPFFVQDPGTILMGAAVEGIT